MKDRERYIYYLLKNGKLNVLMDECSLNREDALYIIREFSKLEKLIKTKVKKGRGGYHNYVLLEDKIVSELTNKKYNSINVRKLLINL